VLSARVSSRYALFIGPEAAVASGPTAIAASAVLGTPRRGRWPLLRIILRADSGFAHEALMAWCEANGVDFIFGLAKNARLNRAIGAELMMVRDESRTSGAPARRFKEFPWSTRKSWSQSALHHHLADGCRRRRPPSLRRCTAHAARWRTAPKSVSRTCSATRTSTRTMQANQLRLWFAAMAYVLLDSLRRLALQATDLADATCGTIRRKAPQDRGSRHRQRPLHQTRYGIEPSRQGGVCHSPSRPARHRRHQLSRPDLASIGA
jgi:hypothetical protein